MTEKNSKNHGLKWSIWKPMTSFAATHRMLAICDAFDAVPTQRCYRAIGTTLGVALLGGFIFSFLHIPLPWMLGPLAGVILWTSLFGGVACWPNGFRNFGLIVLGYIMGRPFTAETAGKVVAQFPEMALMTVLIVLFSLLMSYIIHRQTGIGLASCVIGGVPGGLSQMVLLGEEIAAADGTIVTFMQTVRLLSVVFSVPFLALHGLAGEPGSGVIQGSSPGGDVWADTGALLSLFFAVLAGAWLAVRFRLPTPYLLGPVVATCFMVANGSPAPTLPPTVIIVAQLCVGIYMGAGINLSSLEGRWRTLLPYTLLNVGGVILFSFALAWLLTCLIPVQLVTGFLSTAPGGMAEMGLTAMLVNADLSTVVAYQTFRLLFILLIVPIFLKRWLGSTDQSAK